MDVLIERCPYDPEMYDSTGHLHPLVVSLTIFVLFDNEHVMYVTTVGAGTAHLRRIGDHHQQPRQNTSGDAKTLRYITVELKKIVKNLSCDRSTDDVLRIGHQVGGHAHPQGRHDLARSTGVVAFPVGHPRARSPRR